jgi:aryl-alcohol dehydrogenase-like predicted oxidoreductase
MATGSRTGRRSPRTPRARASEAALDEGITTFDTADVYAGTRAEEVLGRALRGVRRESVEIFTKVYWPTGPGPNDRGLSRKHVMESAHASLRRLQTDYLDMYQAHRYDHATPLEETLRAFDDLVRQGKVLYVGVSEWRAEQIAAAVQIAGEAGFDRIISNQPQYNMIWRVIESEVIPLCEKEGIGQIVWSPIAQGVLTGKYRPGDAPPPASRATDPERVLLHPALPDRRPPRPGAAAQAGRRPGRPELAQLAIAWVLQNPNVAAAIIGATRPEQVRENVRGLGGPARRRADGQDRRDTRPSDRAGPGPHRQPCPPLLTAALAYGAARRCAGVGRLGHRLVLGVQAHRAVLGPALFQQRHLIHARSSSVRQLSPSQVSASLWLLKVSFGRSRAVAGVPSIFSNRHVHAMSGSLLPCSERPPRAPGTPVFRLPSPTPAVGAARATRA